MSKDDEYWFTVMQALGDEFLNKATSERQKNGINSEGWRAWLEAGKEIKATADQALKTAGTAERLVNSNPN